MTASPTSESTLHPFGGRYDFATGTRFDDIDTDWLRAAVDRHRVVLLRGLRPIAPHELPPLARRLGPLQPWRFGSVHEIKRDEDPKNYLYTERAVPLHWDGAFADAVPHWLVFACAAAPGPDAGGETTFVDTRLALERMDPALRDRVRAASFRYTTEKVAHYGGTFVSPAVQPHAVLGFDVLRFAEPVDDLNPVAVEPLAGVDPALIDGAAVAPVRPRADARPPLGDRRRPRRRQPRPAARPARVPPRRAAPPAARQRDGSRARLLARPARRVAAAAAPSTSAPRSRSCSCRRSSPASGPSSFAALAPWEGAALAMLLFHVGDLVNCWFDREVDLHRKTHLAEAITALGGRSIALQIAASALGAALLGLHLAISLDRWWLAGAGVAGALLASQYTAPPLRFKSRGLLQIVSYVGLLFFGPALLVAGLFAARPDPVVLGAATAFGALQTGVLLVNNAEDLDEDEREGVRTASVALGANGAMRAALGLVGVGGAALIALLAALLAVTPWFVLALGLLPLAGACGWNVAWLLRLERATRGDEAAAREAIRKQGKHVPDHVELGAWAAALGAAMVLAARSL
jgi:alpha-ketoglutarate-dependent taurine dioxygenase/4-hydroxybenzoate polyprenyltransferase